MNSKNKKDLTPTLRFPGFTNLGGWKNQKLSEVLEEHGQKSIGNEQVFSVSVRKGLVNQVEHLGRSYSASSTDHYKRVLPNDVVYTKSPTGNFPFGIVKQANLDCEVIVSPLYGVFTPKSAEIGAIIEAYFESPERSIIYLEPLVQKGAKNTININNSKFLSGLIPLPTNEGEQRIIVDCLSSLDELIVKHTNKFNALKLYKKWLMQSLFPAIDEAVPELRFPEFESSGDWKEQKVSDLMVRVSNPVDVKSDEVYREIGIRSHGKGIFHKPSITGNELGSKRVFWVEDDAFVVNIVFAWELAVASTTSNECGMIASHRFPMYKPRNKKSNITYMKYFFLTQKGKELLWIASPGGAGRNKTLGQKDFDHLKFLVPSVKEQTKIANYLTSIDNLIAAQSQKIENLCSHKKGLMQKLFPITEETRA
ncbi:MAG: type I restriction enzyme S subunit [Marinomonas primoryensis]|jgi:type I restriction enzyme S subunit